MNFQQLLLILWAHRLTMLAVFLATVASSVAISLSTEKQYTTRSTVVIDVKSPDPIAGMVLPGLTAPGYMATQVDIIYSDRVAQRVVSALGMDDDPSSRDAWMEATQGRGTLTGWLVERVQRSLEVKPSRESNVIEIYYTSPDPAAAARIANAFAKAYIDTNLELRVEPARQYAEWFEVQTKTQREKLEAAQKALSDYQQQTGIVATDQRLDNESQKLLDLTTQLTQAEAQSTEWRTKARYGGRDTLPEVMQNTYINQLKGEVGKLEAKLSEMSGNYGVNHPAYQRTQAELKDSRQRLEEEISRVTASVGTAGSISAGKETQLRAAIEAQTRKILELRRQRDEISVLMREIDTAQKAFDELSQRTTQSKLESQSIQTNVAILTPAQEPLKHAKPKILLNTVIAMFLGLLLSIGSAMLLELMKRRIRAPEDLAQALELPVLAEIGTYRPFSPERRPEARRPPPIGQRRWSIPFFRSKP